MREPGLCSQKQGAQRVYTVRPCVVMFSRDRVKCTGPHRIYHEWRMASEGQCQPGPGYRPAASSPIFGSLVFETKLSHYTSLLNVLVINSKIQGNPLRLKCSW